MVRTRPGGARQLPGCQHRRRLGRASCEHKLPVKEDATRPRWNRVVAARGRPGSAKRAGKDLERLAGLVTLFVFGTVALIIMAAYLLLVLIGWSRHLADLGSLAVINIALGWTLVGCVIALAMALRTRPEPAPAVQIFQGVLPPSAGPPASHPAPDDSGPPPLLPPPP